MKPIYNNIKAKFPYALDPRVNVDTLANLILRETRFFYENMVVFITTEKAFYYKKDGLVGSSLTDWQKMETSNVTFVLYNNSIPYIKGSCVYNGSLMYIASENTNIGDDPVNTPNKWIQVGTNTYLQVTLTNESEKTITHNISMPNVNVFDTNGNEWIPYIKRNNATELLIKLSEPITGTIEIK